MTRAVPAPDDPLFRIGCAWYRRPTAFGFPDQFSAEERRWATAEARLGTGTGTVVAVVEDAGVTTGRRLFPRAHLGVDMDNPASRRSIAAAIRRTTGSR